MNIFSKKINVMVLAIAMCGLIFSGSVLDAARPRSSSCPVTGTEAGPVSGGVDEAPVLPLRWSLIAAASRARTGYDIRRGFGAMGRGIMAAGRSLRDGANAVGRGTRSGANAVGRGTRSGANTVNRGFGRLRDFAVRHNLGRKVVFTAFGALALAAAKYGISLDWQYVSLFGAAIGLGSEIVFGHYFGRDNVVAEAEENEDSEE